MRIALWSLLSIYVIGFAVVFFVNLASGPVTLGLSLVRASVWPYWISHRTSGRPTSEDGLMMDEPRKTLTDGRQIYPEHRNLRPDGMQNDYVVLADEERAKGFERPVRRTYTHTKCGTSTTMGQTIAESYARDPSFYGGTFCVHCGYHYPLVNPDGSRAFLWSDGTGVGT